MQLELKRIQREVGITFVFVTHDQEEALTMSDRIAVMSEGRVEQIGTPEEIYQHPASVFVAGFIGMANLLPVTVNGREGDRDRRDLRRRAPGHRVPADAGITAGSTRRSWSGPSASVSRAAEPTAARVGVPATVLDLVFQGPVVRVALAASDGSGGRRARRARGGPAAAAPGRPDVDHLGTRERGPPAGGGPGHAPHPKSVRSKS